MKDQKLDSLLRGWEVQPPPGLAGQGDGAWDDHAASIVQKACGAGAATASPADLDALLRAPSLENEPGEPVMKMSGELKMSDDRDPPSAARPSSRAGRPSLKELAERVSKTPPPPSVRPASVVDAASTAKAPPPSMSSSEGRISAVPPVPASVRPPVAPISITHVESAPSIAKTAPVVEPMAVPAAAANDVAKSPVVAQPAPAAKKSSGGLYAIIGVAVVGLAAAAGVAVYMSGKKAPVNQTAAAPKSQPEVVATSEATAQQAPPKEEGVPEVAQDNPKPPSGVDLDSIGDASDSAAPMLTGRLPVASSTAIASTDDTSAPKDGPHHVEPNGTLDEAMREAAGPADENKGTPASTPTGPKNLPDTPPNGSVSAAIGSVRGAARGCVAGADKDSSATIVFGSNGSVQSVSVGGWAAGKPAAGCIQSAVSGAHVEPFTKPSFPVTMTIRP
ncbi:MAG: hypothetical protein U0414_20750 [Polyangiaceae bacterium]